MKKAIFLGSIGVLAETSELQRHAFNRAFLEAGLSWAWEPSEYRELLMRPGGQRRIADYAERLGVGGIDAAELHRRKSEIFQSMILRDGLTLRPGIADLVQTARSRGVVLALVTTTERSNLDAIFQASRLLEEADFCFVGDNSMVRRTKPAPDIYRLALRSTRTRRGEVVALEDSVSSTRASLDAGIRALYFPGAYGAPTAPETTIIEDATDALQHLEAQCDDPIKTGHS